MLTTISVLSCLGCIMLKWFFTFRASRQEHTIAIERSNYHSARKALHLANHRFKMALQEKKQLEAKIRNVERNINLLSHTHKNLDAKKQEMADEIQKQKALLQQKRK